MLTIPRPRGSALDATPARPADLWRLGSDLKPMTATLIGRLVDEGRLSWAATLGATLPDIAAGMQPSYRDVTLVDLLSHQAGLQDLIDSDYCHGLFSPVWPPSRPAAGLHRHGPLATTRLSATQQTPLQ